MVGAFFAFLPLIYGIDCRCLDKYKHPDKCKQFYQFIFEYRSKPCSFFVNMHYILVFHYLLMFIYSMRTRFYDITITLKAYSKMRRATDIISHNLSDMRSIFNACWWLNISNITGCFTACISVNFPAVEFDNAIWFILLSCPLQGVSGTCDTAPNSFGQRHFGHCFLQNMSKFGVARSIDTDLNYRITMLFIRTGTNKSRQSYYQKRSLITFLKVQNRQLGMKLVSGYILLLWKLPLTNFKTKVELPA